LDTPNKNKLPAIAFMIGMGRSGTTLLTNMLNSHPEVISTPENEFVLFAAKSFKDKNFDNAAVVNDFMNLFKYNFHTEPSIWVPAAKIREDIKNSSDKNFVNVCKLTYLNYPLAGQKKNVSLLVDKNPVYSLHTSTLHELFPDAKYIILVRNYKDNVLSRKKYAYKPTSVFELGVSWNFYYETIFKTAALRKLQMYILRYEDLVSTPKETLQKLFIYLDIGFKEEMLNYKEKAGEMKKHLKENTSGEKFDKVMQMHGNLESDINTTRINAHERELSEEENSILDYICYNMANQFGYAKKQPKPMGKWGWRLRKSFYEWKMQMYLLKQKMYYNLPVGMRFVFLKKK
jgi:hypothetical protein